MIFDDAAQKMVLEFTCPAPVLGVRMKRDKVSNISYTWHNFSYFYNFIFHICDLIFYQDCDCDEEPDPRLLFSQFSNQTVLSWDKGQPSGSLWGKAWLNGQGFQGWTKALKSIKFVVQNNWLDCLLLVPQFVKQVSVSKPELTTDEKEWKKNNDRDYETF